MPQSKRFPLYERVLRLYPQAYRKKYGQQMVQTLADMLDDSDSSLHRQFIWARVVLDLPVSVIKTQWQYAGGTMHNQTPNYVKRNALIGLILMLPFFTVLLTRSTQHSTTRYTNIWASSLYLMVVYMPLMAFVISLATFIAWSKRRKVPLWRNLVDIKSSWYLIVVGCLGLLIALFVPFHDSSHCVTGNPVKEVTHIDHTWQCMLSDR